MLPGSTFVLGYDTAVRVLDPKYYGGGQPGLARALAEVRASGCRFVVGGRVDKVRGGTRVRAPEDGRRRRRRVQPLRGRM